MIILIALILAGSRSLHAQELIIINSTNTNKETPILVQKPDNYRSSKRYPLVFMLHGYSENYKQWSNTTDLRKLATDYQMILVCPEGFVNYYLNSPKIQYFRYEDFFFKELVPTLKNKYNIDERNIFITGLSMGGYGALSLFIKHPDFFNTAASTSGALELEYNSLQQISLAFFKSERMTNDLIINLGDPDESKWEKFSISTLLEESSEFDKGFLLDCGLQDPLLSNSIKIKDLALSKNIPIRFSVQPGEHNSEYWSKSIEYHFVYFKQHLK